MWYTSVSGEDSSFLVPEICTTCDDILVSDSSASDVSSEHSCTPDSSVLGLYLLQNDQLPLAFALLKGVQGHGWGMSHLSNLLAVFLVQMVTRLLWYGCCISEVKMLMAWWHYMFNISTNVFKDLECMMVLSWAVKQNMNLLSIPSKVCECKFPD